MKYKVLNLREITGKKRRERRSGRQWRERKRQRKRETLKKGEV